MNKVLVRVLLALAFAVSVVVIMAALQVSGPNNGASWSAIAASLAVVAAVVSAWTGRKVLELQEDAQKPYPYPFIDVESRYDLMQLRVTNLGGTPARNIYLHWNEHLSNPHDRQVRFTEQAGAPEIAVLLPGHSIAVLVGSNIAMYGKYEQMNYSGEIKFEDASGKVMKHAFFISAEQYRNTLTHDNEQLNTHHQLQKIPDRMERLRREVAQLNKLLREQRKESGKGKTFLRSLWRRSR